MKEIEILLPPKAKLPAPAAVESAVRLCGLRITLHGTLAKYPGCIHWHLKKDQQRGTLEVTSWPSKRRMWFSIQSGRTADWVDDATIRLKAILEVG